MNLRLKELYTLYSVQELAEHCLHEESEIEILNNRINKAIEYLEEENEIKTTKLNAIRKYLLNNKLYTFKYDDEELFEITTDKKAKDVLLNIINGGDEE